MIKTYKMALITTLAQNISRAKTDDQRLRAINSFLDMYNKFREESSPNTAIPTFEGRAAANQAVNDGAIGPNSLFIDASNGKLLGVARLVVQVSKEPAKKLA